MISQYVPAGSDVVHVFVQVDAALLMIKKPAAPRPNAALCVSEVGRGKRGPHAPTCWLVPATMLVSAAPPTALWNATMLAIPIQRCSPAWWGSWINIQCKG